MIGVARSWLRRPMFVALARVANAIFFLLTSSYCLLTYSSFAYQQFIKAHMVSWLAGFVVWHHLGFWLMLLVTVWTLLPELRAGRGRIVGWGYLAVSAAIGIALLITPLLPQVENDGRGLALALAALVPPIWLAIFDHIRYTPTFAPGPSSRARLLGAGLFAGAVVWATQVVVIPWRLGQTGEIGLTGGAIAFGIVTSAVAHLFVFAVLASAALAVLAMSRWSRVPGRAEYWLLVSASVVGAWLAIETRVFAALAFTGPVAWELSFALAAMLALVWSSIARILQQGDRARPTAVERWLAPLPGVGSRAGSIGVLACLVLIEFRVVAQVMPFDWDFLLQKLSLLAIWFLAFGYAFGALTRVTRPLTWPSAAAPALAATFLFAASVVAQSSMPDWLDDPAFVPEFVLEGYVAVDPSYRLIHDALRIKSRDDGAFYARLRAHSMIQHVAVGPMDVDFIPRERRDEIVEALDLHRLRAPHIFLLVVDSLRRDYLSPYNPAVRFTPAIETFAKDSVVFRRAFTRYGGSGLSVPAIWTGGMVLHKMYVTPPEPMNALLKLLDGRHYRRLMSGDSGGQPVRPPPPEDELNRGVPIMNQRMCQTLDDLQRKLEAGAQDHRPVFAYALPQDIHISHIRRRPLAEGASYPGFFPQVAAQIEEFDGCFGRFIAFLKESRRYDDSVIVLMSDHGDSLGEALRWGHSYTIFPDVLRIPLIVRIPDRFRQTLTADADAVALSTDLTPTFYLLAGHSPKDLGPLFGRPLFFPLDGDRAARRHEAIVVASSYGGVYGVLRENGARLFIADGVNNRDYAFVLDDRSATRVGVTPGERAADRELILQQIGEIAGLYHFVPRS